VHIGTSATELERLPRSPDTPSRYTSSITRTGHLRASDADRDQVAERLRNAATEGRIGFDELEERLTAALAARTYGELEAVVADLPRQQPARRRTLVPASPVARVAIVLAIVVPVMLAAIVAVTAFFSAWIIWAVIAWAVFGHHHHGHHTRRGHGGPRHGHRQAGAGRSYWT
jgi:hypothetical protein